MLLAPQHAQELREPIRGAPGAVDPNVAAAAESQQPAYLVDLRPAMMYQHHLRIQFAATLTLPAVAKENAIAQASESLKA